MTKRRVKGVPVIIECRLCGHTVTKGTWRPAKREMAAHTARKHA